MRSVNENAGGESASSKSVSDRAVIASHESGSASDFDLKVKISVPLLDSSQHTFQSVCQSFS